MTVEEAKAAVGLCVHHFSTKNPPASHGNAVLLRVHRLGCRIQCWGGISGDKLYEFTVPADELTLGHKNKEQHGKD